MVHLMPVKPSLCHAHLLFVSSVKSATYSRLLLDSLLVSPLPFSTEVAAKLTTAELTGENNSAHGSAGGLATSPWAQHGAAASAQPAHSKALQEGQALPDSTGHLPP